MGQHGDGFRRSDQWYPHSGPIIGSDGLFYGTTSAGGTDNGIFGTVFNFTPNGTLTTLGVFGNEGPQGPLFQAADGSFYGTNSSTASSQIDREPPAGATTISHTFGGHDGSEPYGSLVQGSNRLFHGTTSQGGINSGKGTIFSLSLTGTYTVLHTFQDTQNDPDLMDGATPLAGLIQASVRQK